MTLSDTDSAGTGREDEHAYMASSGLMANAGGAGQDSLWEDNWDDDDIEDDFSKQLELPQ